MQLVATIIIFLPLCSCKTNKMAVTFDLSKSLDDEYFRSDDEEDEGVHYTRITPKYGFLIAKVIQDYNFIWQRLSYKQECEYVDVYKRNDRPFLVEIKVVKPDEETNIYFMNTISTWSPISYTEFNNAKSRKSLTDEDKSGKKKKLKGSFTNVPILYCLSTIVLYSLYNIGL